MKVQLVGSNEEAIKEFWDGQAKQHGASDKATAPDSAYRQLEIDAIIPHIEGRWICDVGCGNGYSTFKFKDAYPHKAFLGVDYSQAMVTAANVAAIVIHSDVSFVTCDVRKLSRLKVAKFHTIISERCLINLQTWEEQQQAILEMKQCLLPEGKLILVENFIDGLNNLNKLREQFALQQILVRWHNRYLHSAEFHKFIEKEFYIKHQENIGNLYYIISRVVYAKLCQLDGTEPQYGAEINRIAAKLPPLGVYNYSPNMMYVLEAKG